MTVLKDKKILVTGGSGFVGSHVCKEFYEKGYGVFSLDTQVSSHPFSHQSVKADITNYGELVRIFQNHKFDAVIHCAALIDVAESQEDPVSYYNTNVIGTGNILEVMDETENAKKFIFSSSCTAKDAEPASAYGDSKRAAERLINTWAAKHPKLEHITLRYFNVCGASPDGEIGENHINETHLIPRAIFNALGIIKKLKVYNPKMRRDYVHVVDVAKANMAAYEYLRDVKSTFMAPRAFDICTGYSATISEVLMALEYITKKKLNCDITDDKRDGDANVIQGDPLPAIQHLLFTAKYSYLHAIEHAWNWYNCNNGQKVIADKHYGAKG